VNLKNGKLILSEPLGELEKCFFFEEFKIQISARKVRKLFFRKLFKEFKFPKWGS